MPGWCRSPAQALRKPGPEKLSVAEVMKEAGLTHGGFYAHFKSKDALLAEALEAVFAQSRARMTKQIEGLPPRHALATFIDFYMSRRHRDNPQQRLSRSPRSIRICRVSRRPCAECSTRAPRA